MARLEAERLGLSSDRLARLGEEVQKRVDEGVVPGAVVAVGRHGKLALLEAFGFRDREAGMKMDVDGIFRIT
jgi:CubicO group peptidase (beta-lactamase class C family)